MQFLKILINNKFNNFKLSEEVALAKKIIRHHPWADMAKFTRGIGEANAVAIRIARANTKRKMLPFVAIMVGTIGICQQI